MTEQKSDHDKKAPGDIKHPFKCVVGSKIDAEEKRLDQIVATIKEEQIELGRVFYQQGTIKELRLKDKEAYEAFKQAVNFQPDNTEFLNNTGRLGYKTADYEQAQQFFNKLLKLTTSELGEDHPDTATSYNNLAMNLNAQGKYDEAEPLLRKGLDIFQYIRGEDHPNTATSYNNVALNLNAQGKYDEAEPLYRKGYELLLKILGEQHPTTRTVLNNWQKNKP